MAGATVLGAGNSTASVACGGASVAVCGVFGTATAAADWSLVDGTLGTTF